ncbi:MAG TPA: hypothetical protein VGS80_06075 [Ktedonobacterales bacterium]|nr:hypothetical protein [Ktedonobacterales bacterium]
MAKYPVNRGRHSIAPPDEADANATSIACVPLAILPSGPARTTLLDLALAGRDCSCYASGGEQTGTWCVWLGDLADVRTDKNGWVPLTNEWVPRWSKLLAEMGLPLSEEEAD